MATFNRERVPERIKMRKTYHFHKAGSEYSVKAAGALRLDLGKLNMFLGLSLDELLEATTEEGYVRAFPAKKAAGRKQ